MTLDSMLLSEVVAHCSENTQKYLRQLVTDARFCFELFRRALLEAQQEAFTHVYRIYEPQVRSWIYRHPGFDSTDETSDYFLSLAFANFYFGLCGEKFNQFSSVAAVLKYLRACVWSCISEYLRGQPPPLLEINDELLAEDTPPGTVADELKEHVRRILPDENDLLLFHLAYTFDMKPAEIYRRHPDLWEDVRAVSVALQRIRRHLRKDDQLRNWAGFF
jgi:hypothetical protein